MFRLAIFCFAILMWAPNIILASHHDVLLTEEQKIAAANNYQKYCALCHGKNREGNAADHAPSLKSKSFIQTTYDDMLATAIEYGRPGTPMAAYSEEMGGPMSKDEINILSKWLIELEDVYQLIIPYRGIKGDVAEGKKIYDAQCANCHGKKAEGVTAPSLNNSVFLASTHDLYIKYAIEEGRQGTAMPAFKQKLSDEEMNNVTSYIRSLASGWSPKGKKLTPLPKATDYVINPEGGAPEFDLRDSRFVSMHQVHQAMQEKKRMILLDARTTSDWHDSHIPGAIPVPYYANHDEMAAALPNDGTWIIAYCACPHAASGKVVDALRKKGYKNTAVLDEGVFKWVAHGYPVEAGVEFKSRAIHSH